MHEAMLAVLYAIGFASLFGGIAVATSYPYHRRAKLCLQRPVNVDPEFKDQFQRQFGVTEMTATSVPLFDVLYHTSKLDPYCLEGVSHLHHAQHFQNLGSVVGFLHENIIPASTDVSDAASNATNTTNAFLRTLSLAAPRNCVQKNGANRRCRSKSN